MLRYPFSGVLIKLQYPRCINGKAAKIPMLPKIVDLTVLNLTEWKNENIDKTKTVKQVIPLIKRQTVAYSELQKNPQQFKGIVVPNIKKLTPEQSSRSRYLFADELRLLKVWQIVLLSRQIKAEIRKKIIGMREITSGFYEASSCLTPITLQMSIQSKSFDSTF
eukprot:TRINITY_DN5206_c0_g1_i1.p3 TRINITY_DN5206_c0_g1~~TRINITY_DN5206_c0_g1_i1.p3  ORF type:complete len:164 (+),score=13.19 TRINITY_DN5206_c0_g1_i1:221-712(+)